MSFTSGKTINKRLILNVFFASLLLLVGSFQPASAQKAADDPDGAHAFISELSENAINVLNDIALTQEERDQQFRDLLRSGFDLDYIGKLVLGRHWRNANRAQKDEYESIFPEYVLRIYTSRLTERGDETFEVINTVPAGSKDIYVRSQIVRNGAPPISADWRVRLKNDRFQVVDLKLEGISMVRTQREEFSARINQVGLDGLISEIRKDAGVDTLEAVKD